MVGPEVDPYTEHEVPPPENLFFREVRKRVPESGVKAARHLAEERTVNPVKVRVRFRDEPTGEAQGLGMALIEFHGGGKVGAKDRLDSERSAPCLCLAGIQEFEASPHQRLQSP